MTLNATSAQLVLAMRSYWGPTGPTQRTMLNYSTGDALTANGANSANVTLTASQVGKLIDFTALFPALVLPLFVYVVDVTSPTGIGFKYYFTNGAAGADKQTVGASGFFAWTSDGATAPSHIYIDNPSSTTQLVLEVGIASN